MTPQGLAFCGALFFYSSCLNRRSDPDLENEAILTLRPVGLCGPAEADDAAWTLAGGPLRFPAVEAVLRRDGVVVARSLLTLETLEAWSAAQGVAARAAELLARLTAARPAFAGLVPDRPHIMGVINVTPDSFSDGGDRFDSQAAIAAGLAMQAAGAAILDVGGESTRPGADPVSLAEELARVIPVTEALAEAGALVSIDTRHAEVMQAALQAGAGIVNDVTALTGDPGSLQVVCASQAPVILMHMQGEPRTMQADPTYRDAALDVFDYLEARVAACEAAGLPRARIAVDPGIGFGKNLAHNLRILEQLALYQGIGCPLLLGASRKAFIGRLSAGEAPKDRLPGSLAVALAGVARGAQFIRVHDVAETRQALSVWRAIVGSEA